MVRVILVFSGVYRRNYFEKIAIFKGIGALQVIRQSFSVTADVNQL